MSMVVWCVSKTLTTWQSYVNIGIQNKHYEYIFIFFSVGGVIESKDKGFMNFVKIQMQNNLSAIDYPLKHNWIKLLTNRINDWINKTLNILIFIVITQNIKK